LQNELLSPNEDRVAGVVAAGVPRDDCKSVGKNIDDLSLTLIAPLGT
jgi:hypothetical protein